MSIGPPVESDKGGREISSELHVRLTPSSDPQACRELLHRELQREVPGPLPQRPLVHRPRRRQDQDRGLETRLQRGQATELAWRPDEQEVFINGRTCSLSGAMKGSGQWQSPGSAFGSHLVFVESPATLK